jgi:type II secretory pathway pseudopilin PulG
MSRLRRVRASTGTGEDSGTTLAEMMVALIVFAVFATVLATTVLNVTRMVRVSAVRDATAQRASTVMQQLSKDLRTATRIGPTGSEVAFLTATPSAVVFYSGVEPHVVQEKLHVVGGVLVRETKQPDDPSKFPLLTYAGAGATTTRQIGSTDLRTSDLFSYLLKGSTTPVPTVTGTQLRDVDAVGITVSVDPDGPGGRQKAIVLQTTVRPYNL